MEERGVDAVRFRYGRSLLSFDKAGYDAVALRAKEITAIWPPKHEILNLPELRAPAGPGYMPLYCAAHWIAAEGGTVDLEANNAEVWRSAFSQLLAHIASADVTVTGERAGEREIVPAHIFAALEVTYPFDGGAGDLTLSEALYLCSYPYLDEEHWRRRFNDGLRNRQGIKWSKLMVPKSDIARIWPFGRDFSPTAVSSGAPGRPTSMHLVEAEYRARRLRCECKETIGEEADALASWLANARSDVPRLKPKTIANRLRRQFHNDKGGARK